MAPRPVSANGRNEPIAVHFSIDDGLQEIGMPVKAQFTENFSNVDRINDETAVIRNARNCRLGIIGMHGVIHGSHHDLSRCGDSYRIVTAAIVTSVSADLLANEVFEVRILNAVGTDVCAWR